MKTEQSKVKLFVVLWKHVMQIQNETPILSCILWKIFKALYSTQLFKIRTLSYCDNVTGHTLVTLGKGMKRRSCVIGGRMRSRASMWDPFCRAKKHMGFLLRQYPWPLATRLRAKKEVVWRNLKKKSAESRDGTDTVR